MNPISITALAPRNDRFWMSDALIAALKQRVASNYYDRPDVIEIIARALTDRVWGAACGVQGTTASRESAARIELHIIATPTGAGSRH